MIVNKKLDRFKQWAGERMGGEVRTNVSDDFKAMELEMNMRQEGMERLHKAMVAYIRVMSKRNEGDDKEKILPVGYLGGTMVMHGEDFECNSEFGQCLIGIGRTNERIARIQEQFVSSATNSWLESLEKSLNQMKEYQTSRKKLETRRLAYDTTLAKMQKAKREDFRAEEELRSQKFKYEEANDDVYRRMQDIRESETDSVADLGTFLDAQLDYHDRCREVLLQLKSDWPAGPTQPQMISGRPSGRPRSNTARSHQDRYGTVEENEPQHSFPEHRPTLRPSRTTSSYQMDPPSRDSSVDPYPRPVYSRTPTFEGPTQLRRGLSPASSTNSLNRVASDSTTISNMRTQLRVISKGNGTVNGNGYGNGHDAYYDSTDTDTSPVKSSPDRYFSGSGRSVSPTASTTGHPSGYGNGTSSRYTNGIASNSTTPSGKKAPPPPPPSRAKKPPPPPPPAKRVISGLENM